MEQFPPSEGASYLYASPYANTSSLTAQVPSGFSVAITRAPPLSSHAYSCLHRINQVILLARLRNDEVQVCQLLKERKWIDDMIPKFYELEQDERRCFDELAQIESMRDATRDVLKMLSVQADVVEEKLRVKKEDGGAVAGQRMEYEKHKR